MLFIMQRETNFLISLMGNISSKFCGLVKNICLHSEYNNTMSSYSSTDLLLKSIMIQAEKLLL